MSTIELQVGDDPFVLYRCSACDTTHWTHDNQVVPFEAVVDMMRQETQRRGDDAQQRRQATRRAPTR
ncbi:MAG: hypothetical protein GEU74_05330 [Nitriliruptorales bacterium]|nr:hypothetical protein [Nitriliruptorales bacterium]